MRRVLLLIPLLLAGCGGASAGTVEPPAGATAAAPPPPTAGPTTAPPPPAGPTAAPPPAPATGAPPPAPPAALEPARCTPDLGPGCTAHTGRVLTIESVDPDGDGDLHVIATGGSVTAPGLTVFDVSRDLRPAADPRPGDRVTGAGPVVRGSFRQQQIEVRTFRVAPAAG